MSTFYFFIRYPRTGVLYKVVQQAGLASPRFP